MTRAALAALLTILAAAAAAPDPRAEACRVRIGRDITALLRDAALSTEGRPLDVRLAPGAVLLLDGSALGGSYDARISGRGRGELRRSQFAGEGTVAIEVDGDVGVVRSRVSGGHGARAGSTSPARSSPSTARCTSSPAPTG